jgi:sugar/nucleoside kinase (ribokinase family)
MHIPHFISIGHITHDLVGNGITPGGPALYSTCTARNLGVATGLITSFSRPLFRPSLFQEIAIQCQESQQTTTFANLYNEHGERRQIIENLADPLQSTLIPPAWRAANIVNLCPVANEYTAELVHLFDNALIGVCPQGWMRRWDKNGRVFKKDWDTFTEVLPSATAVFFSEEDVADPAKTVETYLPYTQMVVVTRGKRGASVFCQDGESHAPAFPAVEVDPTGAGDVFATAFLINYFDTRNPQEALRFANCVASFVVEKEGIYGIPLREDVQRRLRQMQGA